MVVLNYNGWQDTIACLHSLLLQEYPPLQILVVDNASTDDSVVRLRAEFPQVDLVQAAANKGFSAGNNFAIEHPLAAASDFVWLLNNDTVAPPDTCAKLVAAAIADPRIGLVGSVLRYLYDPVKVQAWGGGRVSRTTGFGRHFTAPTPLGPDSFFTFASVLLRRDMLNDVGLLDDGYFMYFEDSDLCFRARARGWQLAVASGTAVLHKEGGSAAPSEPVRRNRTVRIVTASGMRFLSRYGRPRSLAPFVYLASRLAKRALCGDIAGVRAVLLGMRDWKSNQPRAFQES